MHHNEDDDSDDDDDDAEGDDGDDDDDDDGNDYEETSRSQGRRHKKKSKAAKKNAIVPLVPASVKPPPEWVETVDENTGSTFYYNRRTGQTTWERPLDHIEAESISVAPVV